MGKLLSFTEARRESIASEFASIEKAKAGVEDMRRKYDEELAGIENTRRVRIQEAVADAHRIAGEIRDEARKEAIALRVKAGEDINLDMDKANVAYRDQMVNSVITATEKLIRTRLDDAAASQADQSIPGRSRVATRGTVVRGAVRCRQTLRGGAVQRCPGRGRPRSGA